MQNNPLVTIICLCYNHSNFVIESLCSVLNQTYKNIELIVVDDCSEDNSKSVIRKWIMNYPGVTFITNKTNLGNTKSFNKALKTAKGEFIIDLAADDVLYPNCVSLQIKAFRKSKYENLALVYGNCELISEVGNFQSYYFAVDSNQKVVKKRYTGDIYLSVLSGGDSICSVTSMVKKEVFDNLGGYDESLAYEDLDFWIRVSRQYEVDFIDEILIKKRVVSDSLGSQFFKRKSKINYSTHLILKKAIRLNKSKLEYTAILKRVHFETLLNLKNHDYLLAVKYILLEIYIRYKIISHKL